MNYLTDSFLAAVELILSLDREILLTVWVSLYTSTCAIVFAALFGIPTAHEDDPVRAVKATFEIHELVRKISPEVEERIDTKLRMHTGINTGLVVTHFRDIREGSYGITGDTVNIGARLASKANKDEILIGPETHSLRSSFFNRHPPFMIHQSLFANHHPIFPVYLR